MNPYLAPFLLLLQSRKFWLSLLGFIAAAVLFAQHQIGAEEFVNAIVALVTVLAGSIALEDAAGKLPDK